MSSSKLERLGYDVSGGSLVTNVVGCTGAEKAGLQPLDYLYAVDGVDASNSTPFFCLLSDVEPGSSVKVSYMRAGKSRSTTLTLGRRGDACQDDTPFPRKGFFGLNSGHTDNKPGVVVDVSSEGPASELGLQDGDRILAVNGYPVADWDDISTVKRLITDINDVSIEYERDGTSANIKGALAESEHTNWNWNNASMWNNSNEDCDCDEDGLVNINVDKIERTIDDAMKSIDWDGIERDTEEAVRDAMESVREAMRDIHGRRGRNGSWDSEEVDPKDMDARVETLSPTSPELDVLRKDVDMPRTASLNVREFSASPNPSGGRFRVSFNLPTAGPTTIAVYSIAGREVYRYDLGEFSGAFTDELDIMRNGPGTYVLVVRQGNEMFLRKLVLVKR